MKKKSLILSILLFVSGAVFSQSWFTPEVEQRANDILKNMTLHEKLIYIGGTDWMYTKPIPRLGIPSLKMSDATLGVGTWGLSTAYPSSVLLAATWNRDLAYQQGVSVASDCKARGVNIILGPGVNIYRAPMCGRNFEYTGEDPYLAAETSTAYIKGVQENGVMAVIKHLTANYQEYDRNNISSDIDERTLNEIYFPAFRSAVQKAEVGSIMTSYNKLNGVWTTLCPWLLKEVVRNQWGFNGLVMSDWGSTHIGLAAATSGLDLEMPSNERQTEDSLRVYLSNGQISIADIDLKLKHILQTFIAFGFFDHEQLDSSILLNNPTSAQTALNISEEGIVLLKNEENILPIKSDDIKKIAVIGNNALINAAGGGSSMVSPFSYTSYYDGLRTLGEEKGIEVTYVDKYDHFQDVIFTSAGSDTKGFSAQYFNNKDLNGVPVATKIDQRIGFDWTIGTGIVGVNKDNFSVRWTGELRPTVSGNCEFVVSGDDGFRLFIDDAKVIDEYKDGAFRERRFSKNVTAGQKYSVRLEYYQAEGGASIDFAWIKAGDNNRFVTELNKADVVVAFIGHNQSSEAEAGDRPANLPTAANDLILQAGNCSKPIVAVVNAGGNVYMQDWEPKLKALAWGWYGGQEAGIAMAKMLLGDISPSGKLPVTFEKRWADNPAYNSYYDPDNDKHVAFTEGVFIGYRGYDKLNRMVQYPFGYGLSYTTFDLSNMQVSNLEDSDNLFEVSLVVENTGAMAGAEVVQLYVNKRESSPVERPVRELKNYEKVYLQPGEKKTVTMTLTKDDFSYFCVDAKKFVVDNGRYNIELGVSSRDIKLTEEVSVNVASSIARVSSESNAFLIPTVVKAGEKIRISSGMAETVEIYNLQGQRIFNNINTEIIETENLRSGTYLALFCVNNIINSEKFIVL